MKKSRGAHQGEVDLYGAKLMAADQQGLRMAEAVMDMSVPPETVPVMLAKEAEMLALSPVAKFYHDFAFATKCGAILAERAYGQKAKALSDEEYTLFVSLTGFWQDPLTTPRFSGKEFETLPE